MSKKRLILNKDQLDKLLKARQMRYADLARMVGWSKENLYYHIKNRTLRCAEVCGEALQIDPKLLLKLERRA